jgi:hypothetical protein
MKPKANILGTNVIELDTDEGVYLQSYRTIVAFRPRGGGVVLDGRHWDYSVTTAKHVSQWLQTTSKDIRKRIADGTYQTADLNV